MEIINQTGRRIDNQRCPSDNQNIRIGDIADRFFQDLRIQTFLIENDIRFDNSSALFTPRNALGIFNIFHAVRRIAFYTVIAQHGPMQFQHFFTAGFLMKPVNILCNNGFQLPHLFQPRQCQMRFVGLSLRRQHLIFIEAIKFLRLVHKKRMRNNRFRRIFIFHMI